MKRILFLDVNGVLNSRCDSGAEGLGDSHLRQLKRIVNESGCEIVLTSSWRLADDLMEKLRIAFDQYAIPIWIGVTPDLFGDRCEEILAWLRVNGPCIGVVIDDDCVDVEKTGLRCIETSVDHGLTADLATEVIRAFDSQ